MMNHLKLKVKEGRRVQTWPQMVESGFLEVPRLPLSKTDRFFVMGSCFVNEIRHHLEKNGVEVYPKLRPEIQELFPENLKARPAWGPWDERIHYQNYTPFSVEQEIDLALGDRTFDDAALIKKGADYWDPYRKDVRTPSADQTLEIRRRMSAALKEGIRTADVAIMTLGSIESFLVKKFGGEIPEFRAAFLQDLEFREHTIEETEACLTRICDKLLNRCGFREIILTVSPIPMGRTHRNVEVALANCYSKSVLRACVEQVVRKMKHVHYFPSYEFVTTKGGYRTTDYLHIQSEVVAEVTAAFLASFSYDGAQETGPERSRLKIVDVCEAGPQRQLVLVRRDNVEHLILLGGPTDVVVETNIVTSAGTRAPQVEMNDRLEATLRRADELLKPAPSPTPSPAPARPAAEMTPPGADTLLTATPPVNSKSSMPSASEATSTPVEPVTLPLEESATRPPAPPVEILPTVKPSTLFETPSPLAETSPSLSGASAEAETAAKERASKLTAPQIETLTPANPAVTVDALSQGPAETSDPRSAVPAETTSKEGSSTIATPGGETQVTAPPPPAIPAANPKGDRPPDPSSPRGKALASAKPFVRSGEPSTLHAGASRSPTPATVASETRSSKPAASQVETPATTSPVLSEVPSSSPAETSRSFPSAPAATADEDRPSESRALRADALTSATQPAFSGLSSRPTVDPSKSHSAASTAVVADGGAATLIVPRDETVATATPAAPSEASSLSPADSAKVPPLPPQPEADSKSKLEAAE